MFLLKYVLNQLFEQNVSVGVDDPLLAALGIFPGAPPEGEVRRFATVDGAAGR